jgi:hypothetical protein
MSTSCRFWSGVISDKAGATGSAPAFRFFFLGPDDDQ